jgi:hypothetical protein
VLNRKGSSLGKTEKEKHTVERPTQGAVFLLSGSRIRREGEREGNSERIITSCVLRATT